MDHTPPPMAAEEFLLAFAEEFDQEDASIGLGTGLWDDLGLDSFDAVRLILWLETISEVVLELDVPPALFTLGDAHRYHQQLARPSVRAPVR
ncbi:MAG: hypothetical protein R2716_13250 [Microthrixaceae bacterium]